MGNSIFTPEIFSRSRTQAMCDWSESMETPMGLDVEPVPVLLALGELDELGGADGGEVGRVREEHDPLALGGVVGEADDAVSGFGLEVGCELEDAGDAGFGHFFSCAAKDDDV